MWPESWKFSNQIRFFFNPEKSKHHEAIPRHPKSSNWVGRCPNTSKNQTSVGGLGCLGNDKMELPPLGCNRLVTHQDDGASPTKPSFVTGILGRRIDRNDTSPCIFVIWDLLVRDIMGFELESRNDVQKTSK